MVGASSNYLVARITLTSVIFEDGEAGRQLLLGGCEGLHRVYGVLDYQLQTVQNHNRRAAADKMSKQSGEGDMR